MNEALKAALNLAHDAGAKPILYTDEINGQQTRRDDLWLMQSSQIAALLEAHKASLSAQQEQKPIGYIIDDDLADLQKNGVSTIYAQPQERKFGPAWTNHALYLAAPPASQPQAALTDEQIEKHTLEAGECPRTSKVMLVSSIRRLLAAQPSAEAIRREALEQAEEAVTTLYEQAEPPYLVDICNAIRALAQAKGEK